MDDARAEPDWPEVVVTATAAAHSGACWACETHEGGSVPTGGDASTHTAGVSAENPLAPGQGERLQLYLSVSAARDPAVLVDAWTCSVDARSGLNQS